MWGKSTLVAPSACTSGAAHGASVPWKAHRSIKNFIPAMLLRSCCRSHKWLTINYQLNKAQWKLIQSWPLLQQSSERFSNTQFNTSQTHSWGGKTTLGNPSPFKGAKPDLKGDVFAELFASGACTSKTQLSLLLIFLVHLNDSKCTYQILCDTVTQQLNQLSDFKDMTPESITFARFGCWKKSKRTYV